MVCLDAGDGRLEPALNLARANKAYLTLRESLLGGVSRDLLDRLTIPVLMSH